MVLAKKEEGKLKVKVAVGRPGVRVVIGDGFQNRLRNTSSAEAEEVTNLILAGGGWVKEPEWWEGEAEFEEGKDRIDYVFLGKEWYGVGEVSDDGWERVGYFPVELNKAVEVRAARKSKEEKGEVWTKLVQNTKLKVQNNRSVLEEFLRPVLSRQERGKQSSGMIFLGEMDPEEMRGERQIEVWYPVWEGNDLERRGNRDVAKNCDLLKRGRVVSDQRLVNNEVVIYRAEGYGVNCDYIPYERYGGFENYFLIVKGENKVGRSLKIYLHSLEKDQRVMLEELLPKGEFEKLYPIEMRKGGGMVLNLETRSFGRVASENVVKQVLLVPVKWGWIRNLKTQNPKLETTTQNSKLEIEKVRKLGTGLYLVSLRESNQQPATSNQRLLTLSQGYERGWEAIEIQNDSSKLNIRRLEQVRVNGWKNGFVLSNQQPETNSKLVVIFYWPQLLEWVGLMGLVGVLIWLWRAHV